MKLVLAGFCVFVAWLLFPDASRFQLCIAGILIAIYAWID